MRALLSAGGDEADGGGFWGELEEKLLETPTPVPEPPNPRMLPHRETWSPYLEQKHMENPTWRFEDGYTAGKGLGPQRPELRETHSRFLSNEQYLLRTLLYAAGNDLSACSTKKGQGRAL